MAAAIAAATEVPASPEAAVARETAAAAVSFAAVEPVAAAAIEVAAKDAWFLTEQGYFGPVTL